MADESKTGAAAPQQKTASPATASAAPVESPSAEPLAADGATRTAVAEEIRRTGGVTEEAAEEFAAAGVHPKLDNRVGRQRPPSITEPKPQQVTP